MSRGATGTPGSGAVLEARGPGGAARTGWPGSGQRGQTWRPSCCLRPAALPAWRGRPGPRAPQTAGEAGRSPGAAALVQPGRRAGPGGACCGLRGLCSRGQRRPAGASKERPRAGRAPPRAAERGGRHARTLLARSWGRRSPAGPEQVPGCAGGTWSSCCRPGGPRPVSAPALRGCTPRPGPGPAPPRSRGSLTWLRAGSPRRSAEKQLCRAGSTSTR